MNIDIFDLILRKKLVFATSFNINKGAKTPTIAAQKLACQLDIALMHVGFKMSHELFEYVTYLPRHELLNVAGQMIHSIKKLVGDHVNHNTYFINFPNNVPDTLDFWWHTIIKYIFTGTNTYGRYNHTYENMLEHHSKLKLTANTNQKIINLGKTEFEELQDFSKDLIAATVPLSPEDRKLLATVLPYVNISNIPAPTIRENKAIVNGMYYKLHNRTAYPFDTVTDVLRFAAVLSDADVTLVDTAFRFKSFNRPTRRFIMVLLDAIVSNNSEKMDDANAHLHLFKRLGEKVHPGEFKMSHAAAHQLFQFVRGDYKHKTYNNRLESALSSKDFKKAVELLKVKPGVFIRRVVALSLLVNTRAEKTVFTNALKLTIKQTSARVLLGLREHIYNLLQANTEHFIYVNKEGKGYSKPVIQHKIFDNVANQSDLYENIVKLIDAEIESRIPVCETLVVDSNIENVALPLSEKSKASGFKVYPRGSEVEIKENIVRFFMYWKQKQERTDLDLSVILLDENFNLHSHLSWTMLRNGQLGTHSGDITSAPNGASEFIDINLNALTGIHYVIPTVNKFSGETYDELEESFFGYMERNHYQQGKPFEASTVQTKSDMRGSSSILMPLILMRDKNNKWIVKWTSLNLKGLPRFNTTENNKFSSTLLSKSIAAREYTKVSYLTDMYANKAKKVIDASKITKSDLGVTFIGLERPDSKLAEDAVVIDLNSIKNIIPE